MLYYDRAVVSKSRRCIIGDYYYFLRVNSRTQLEVWNGCHDLMQTTMSFNDVAIASVKENDYRILFLHISKDEAEGVINNAGFKEKMNN